VPNFMCHIYVNSQCLVDIGLDPMDICEISYCGHLDIKHLI